MFVGLRALLGVAFLLVAGAAVPSPRNLSVYYTAWPQPVSTLAYASGFFACEGPYAICAFAACTPLADSDPPVAECGCYAQEGPTLGFSPGVLKKNLKDRMTRECTGTNACVTIKRNETQFCKQINANTMYPGYDYVSTYNPQAWGAITGFNGTAPKLCFGGTVALCYSAACRSGPPTSPYLPQGNPAFNATCYCPYYTTKAEPISFAADFSCGPRSPQKVTPKTIIYNGA